MSRVALMQRTPHDVGAIPVRTGLLRRQDVARRQAIFDAPHEGDRNGRRSLAPSTGAFSADFSRVPPRAMAAQICDDGLGTEAVASSNAATSDPDKASTGTGEEAQAETNAATGNQAAGTPQQAASKKGKVTALDVITGTTGAVSGFVAIPGGGNLNTPGPFNDLTTGSCKNIHQMKFTLSGTTSSEVGLIRTVNRTATAGGVTQPKNGPDGPSAGTFVRPTNDVIAVADSPGYSGTGLTVPFPISYQASFNLYAFDLVQKGIYAQLAYTVSVAKQSLTDPNPTNSIAIVSKTIF